MLPVNIVLGYLADCLNNLFSQINLHIYIFHIHPLPYVQYLTYDMADVDIRTGMFDIIGGYLHLRVQLTGQINAGKPFKFVVRE